MTSSPKPRICVVGAGPAGLAAAETLALAGAQVDVFDRMPSPARKFLMAGRGGLNITHSEALDHFLTRYGGAESSLRPAIEGFQPADLRAWSASLGEPCFVGASGRVFPKSFKASPLLRAWLRRLDGLGVQLFVRHRLTTLDQGLRLSFETPDGRIETAGDAIVLALGGASWPRLGSDGSWAEALTALGVAIAPLRPANCGFHVAWSDVFRGRFAGAPIKGAAWTFEGGATRGEATISTYGLEGGALYALSGALREAIERDVVALLVVDLKPDLAVEELARRLSHARPGDTLSQRLRKSAGLSPAAIGLLREAHPEPAREPAALAGQIKRAPLRLTATAPLSRAISSAGGVRFEEIDGSLMLKRVPGVFVCGEMLDFEAPTGGYLLQAAFATGVAAGRGAAARLGLASS